MSNIPPAPPLPTARPQSSTTRSAFARFVTQPFTRPSQVSRQDGIRSNPSQVQHVTNNNPRHSSSQHLSLSTRGAEITSLDKNKDGTQAILAGRNVLKTIKVDGNSCIEGIDIRAILINQDGNSATKPLDIYDVKWSQGDHGSYIATATASGKIVLYDVAAHGVESWRIHEHPRTVFKLAVNPHSSSLLLSASHDASVILWDLRDAKPALRIASRDRYRNNSGGVRDVKWSPTDGTEFAFSTDMGSVQKWDFRHNTKAKLKINAHEKYCTSIDWHPDGKHLVSAGHDKWIKVWDFASGSKRQRAKYFVRTPYPVVNVSWRPEYWAPGDHGAGSWQCTQVVASYERHFSPVVHLWDFRRPHVPHREMYWWNTAPTGLLWHDQRLLWSVDRDGVFQQCDVHYAPKIIDRRPMQALALSPTGELCAFTQRRPRPKPGSLTATNDVRKEESNNKLSDEKFENLKGVVEADLSNTYLSTSYRRGQQRLSSNTPAKSAASTPPSYSDTEAHHVAWLDDSLARGGGDSSAHSQVAFRGTLDGTLSTPSFTYLAQKYRFTALPARPLIESFLSANQVFEQNASYAQKTGAYRVAQTWRILGTLISEELSHRAQLNRQRRLDHIKSSTIAQVDNIVPHKQPTKALLGWQGSLSSHVAVNPTRSIALAETESSSNIQTPLAKAQSVIAQDYSKTAEALPNPEQEQLQLPPLLLKEDSSSTESTSQRQQAAAKENSSAFAETQWFPSATDINARRVQAQNWHGGSRRPLDLGYQTASPAENVHLRLERHDSNDSFGMFSASSDSQVLGTSVKSVTSGKIAGSDLPHGPGSDNAALAQSMSYFGQPIPKNEPQLETKGDLSWVTSSSSLDFGDRSPHVTNHIPNVPDYHNPSILNSHTKLEDNDVAQVRSYDNSPNFILDDFTNVDNITNHQPVTAAQMLQKLRDYYTIHTPNPQTLHHLAMVLKPLLVPRTSFTTVADGVGRSANKQIQTLQEDAIMFAYHDQLQSLQIYNPSIVLALDALQRGDDRKDGFAIGSQIGLVCLGCNKPISNPLTKFRCDNCGKRQSNCPICWQKYPAYEGTKKTLKQPVKRRGRSHNSLEHDVAAPDDPNALYGAAATIIPASDEAYMRDSTTEEAESVPQTNHAILWQSCLVCGHGAHASCLQHIQNDPKIGGKCPTDGCLCDCIPGTYRTRLNRETEESRRKGSVSWVRGDTASLVGESSAVKGARALLDRDTQQQQPRDGGGTLSTSASSDKLSKQQQQQEERRVRLVEPKLRRG